ncbi:TPA: hypothetical protein ACXNQX_000986 [Pseudomonas aeruginosa]
MNFFKLSLKASHWDYDTSAGGSANLGVFAGSGGTIRLRSPSKAYHTFSFIGAGAGLGVGARLPRFGKVNVNIKGVGVGGAGASESFYSIGKVFTNESILKNDLSPSDFRGPCLWVEGGFGLIAGFSSSMLLFGLDPLRLGAMAALATNPGLANLGVQLLVSSANGAISMGGLNAGVQVGGGCAAYVGLIS